MNSLMHPNFAYAVILAASLAGWITTYTFADNEITLTVTRSPTGMRGTLYWVLDRRREAWCGPCIHIYGENIGTSAADVVELSQLLTAPHIETQHCAALGGFWDLLPKASRLHCDPESPSLTYIDLPLNNRTYRVYRNNTVHIGNHHWHLDDSTPPATHAQATRQLRVWLGMPQ